MKAFIEQNKKWVLILGVIFFIIFTKNLAINSSNEISEVNEVEEQTLVEETEEVKGEEEGEEEEPTMIYVDIKGAVKQPGVYELEVGSRTKDVIEKAGGMTHENTNCINLSHKLIDEEVIVIPDVDTLCETPESSTQSSEEQTGKININEAESSELETLTGIGETRAADIIAYREANGAFTQTEDLQNVSGIGESTYNQIKEEITV